MKKEILNNWINASDELAKYFAKRYFGNDTEQWWVADEPGGVFYINDRFFSPNDMVDYIVYKYSQDEMFDHYDYALSCHEKGESPINIRTYKRLKQEDVSRKEK